MQEPNSLFCFLNVIDSLKSISDTITLEELCPSSSQDIYFSSPQEVAVSGEIFRITSIHDCKIGDALHILRLSGRPLQDPEGIDSFLLTAAVFDYGDSSSYQKILETVNNSDINSDLREIAVPLRDVEIYLTELFINEYQLRCAIMKKLAEVSEGNSPDIVTKATTCQDLESVESLLIDTIDKKATLNTGFIFDGPEYCIQEPFPGIAGMYSKKDKSVRLLGDEVMIGEIDWSDVGARHLWERVDSDGVREKATVETVINLVLREMDVLQASLAIRRVSVLGEVLSSYRKNKLLKALRKNLF